MAKCKICGKEFTPCRTNTPLNWRRVACCVEHGAIWFEKVEAARSAQPEISPDENAELQTLLAVEEPAEAADEEEISLSYEFDNAEPACGTTADEGEPESPDTFRGRKHK